MKVPLLLWAAVTQRHPYYLHISNKEQKKNTEKKEYFKPVSSHYCANVRTYFRCLKRGTKDSMEDNAILWTFKIFIKVKRN